MRKVSLLLLSASLLINKSYAQLHVSTSGTKNVLLEIATGAWTGWAPDAFQDVQEKVLPMYPNTIIAAWHNGDSMQISGDPYCTGSGYILGFPNGTVNRVGGGLGRPWETAVGVEAAISPNFDVDMVSTYNPVTRVMDILVTGTALTSLTGNWNINAYLLEDSISSSTTGFSQHNYYGTVATTSCTGSTSWYNSGGDPVAPSMFSHNYVVRSVLCPGGSIWGESAFTNPTTGTSVTKHYTYTVPAGINPMHINVVGMVQKFGTTTADRAIENAVSAQAILMPAGSSSIAADSFTVYTNNLCIGGEFYITTPAYASGLSIASDYGDGSSDTHPILSGGGGGYADFTHTYATSGSYTVQHKLLNGSSVIDSVTFTYAYQLCNVIPVEFYLDTNSNCIKDSAELSIYQPSLTRIDSNGTPVDTISATSGFYYTAYGNPGDVYKFTVITPPTGLSVACPSTGYINDTLQTGVFFSPTLYFGDVCTGGTAFDLRVFTTVRAGIHTFRGTITVDNTYCPPTPGVVTMHLSPKYTYWGSSITPSSVSGGTITWNTSALTSVSAGPVIITVQGEAPGSWYAFGDTVSSDYRIDPTSGDADTTSNTCGRIDSIRAGYDPNYIEVTPSGLIPAGTLLRYTIEFENTGNDTAFNIRVMDTLSDYVDASSMRLVSTTAKMMVTNLHDAAGHNTIKFDFPNINLLDSSHHGKCTGMIIYTIKTKAPLAIGTNILNHAGIYFDNNPVIMTNTAKNVIGMPSAVPVVENNGLQIYPNPAANELMVSMNKDAYSSFAITNAVGVTVMDQHISGTQTKISLSNIPSGIYYITLRGENGSTVKRFVKM